MIVLGDLGMLPLHVVELVIQESQKYDGKGFCGLRLACKALNELVEPKVFFSIDIRFRSEDYKWKPIPEFLSSLVLGNNPYVRWAKELRLHQLVPIEFSGDQWSRSDPQQGEERETMLACQTEWLVPAIESLAQVEHVELWASRRGPYRDVLCALARLPRLRGLLVSCGYPAFALDDVPLAGFSHLHKIQFRNLVLTPLTVEGLKGLLARSPAISNLALNARADPDETELGSIDLNSLVDGVELTDNSPAFLSTLKQLAISATRFRLSPSCALFLRALTSLTISEDSTHVPPLFWKTLQSHGIHLQESKLNPLRQAAVDYLLSYSGLRAFTLAWSDNKEEPKDDKQIARQFFRSVLPRHQCTMRSISLEHTTKLGPWAITKSYLKSSIYPCKHLTHLTVIYYFPSPNEKRTHPVIPLSQLLSEINENLPRLETLRLIHTRKFHQNFECGNGRITYYQMVGRAFASYLVSSKSIFYAKYQPQFSLDTGGTVTYIPTPARTSSSASDSRLSRRGQCYRLKLLNASDNLELRLDEDVRDIDSDNFKFRNDGHFFRRCCSIQ